ncbi:iron-containing alcohol dehydrogenase [Neobacillus sp. LXY-4]|uniref:iron-containing alcohol dehydrogenase n=1 Tax=Neobacillus sp. LXY-4 TaxID=3379826 RepID=UPI003EE2EB24
MENFSFHNPTKIIFGKNQLELLKSELEQYGKNILVVYGGGSIKKIALYEGVMSILNELGANIYELTGVEPNPRLTSVEAGAALCKKHNIDFVLAVGGGSVLDCTKAIVAAAKYDGNAWDLITNKAEITDTLPFGAIITLAATGSEMNNGAVITNWDTKEKYPFRSLYTYPKFSILDPEYTYTVPLDQTIYGIVDIMAHVFEQYFHHQQGTELIDGFGESILKTVIETAPKLLNDLHNYDYRASILYCGTLAQNRLLSTGIIPDWATHNIEHAVSAVYDIPHGGGLSILFPHWMEYVIDERIDRFTQLATRVFGVDPSGKSKKEVALEGIECLRAFWTSIGAPSRLADYGIGEDSIEIMTEKAMARGDFGNFKKLTSKDVAAIYRASL